MEKIARAFFFLDPALRGCQKPAPVSHYYCMGSAMGPRLPGRQSGAFFLTPLCRRGLLGGTLISESEFKEGRGSGGAAVFFI